MEHTDEQVETRRFMGTDVLAKVGQALTAALSAEDAPSLELPEAAVAQASGRIARWSRPPLPGAGPNGLAAPYRYGVHDRRVVRERSQFWSRFGPPQAYSGLLSWL